MKTKRFFEKEIENEIKSSWDNFSSRLKICLYEMLNKLEKPY